MLSGDTFDARTPIVAFTVPTKTPHRRRRCRRGSRHGSGAGGRHGSGCGHAVTLAVSLSEVAPRGSVPLHPPLKETTQGATAVHESVSQARLLTDPVFLKEDGHRRAERQEAVTGAGEEGRLAVWGNRVPPELVDPRGSSAGSSYRSFGVAVRRRLRFHHSPSTATSRRERETGGLVGWSSNTNKMKLGSRLRNNPWWFAVTVGTNHTKLYTPPIQTTLRKSVSHARISLI